MTITWLFPRKFHEFDSAKPKIYDTAYHLRAKLTPKNQKKDYGFMFGNGIMPTPGLLSGLRTIYLLNAILAVQSLFSEQQSLYSDYCELRTETMTQASSKSESNQKTKNLLQNFFFG